MTKQALVRTIRANGYALSSILGVDNAKTSKGYKAGYLTGIVYLMPDSKLCPMSETAQCAEACLVSAGRGRFDSVAIARRERTRLFRDDRSLFLSLLCAEIDGLITKANKLGKTPCVRLNGTSDLDWSRIFVGDETLFERYSSVQFYDYTKSPSIVRKATKVANWHVTMSYSEANAHYSALSFAAMREHGVNLAVVFGDKLPEYWHGLRVIDGDKDDLRFRDPAYVIVGLTAKGKAKQDQTGFVVRNTNLIARG
jgi:hypothetical protein